MKPISVLKKDPVLYQVIKNVGDYKIRKTKNPYESLVEAIITQQLSGAAAKSISRKFRQIYFNKFPKPIDVVKTPKRILRKSGLSNMKADYIKDLSKRIVSEKIDLESLSKLSDEEIISKLVEVRGIGRWTAEMFLIFSLGRLDVLPIGDLGLQKGIQKLYEFEKLPSRKQIEEVASKWRPYRTIATWYVWKSLKQFDAIG